MMKSLSLLFQNESNDSSSTDSSPSPGKSSGKKDGSGPTPDLKKYFNPNHVDLKTLSELTQSVEPGKDEGSRSKRTCVRVREEIAKLNELLDANGEKIKIPAVTPNRTGGGGVSKGQTKGGKRRRSSQGTTSKKKKIKTSSVKEGKKIKINQNWNFKLTLKFGPKTLYYSTGYFNSSNLLHVHSIICKYINMYQKM